MTGRAPAHDQVNTDAVDDEDGWGDEEIANYIRARDEERARLDALDE